MGEINDLPIELFSLVLKYLVHHDIGTPGNYQWYGDPVVLDVLSVAQVCKKWRHIALNTPSLWTTLNDVLHPFVIEYALEQSSNLPLKVCLDFRWYFIGSDDEDSDEDGFGHNGGDEIQWQAVQKLASQIPRTSHLVVRFHQGCPYASLRIILRLKPTENLVDLFRACKRWLSFHDGHGVIDNIKIDGGHVCEDLQLEGFSSTEPAFRFSITVSEEVEPEDVDSDDEDDVIELDQIITVALSELPLDNVHTLHFYTMVRVSHQFWARILSTSLLNLQTVEVCPLSARYWSEIMACSLRRTPFERKASSYKAQKAEVVGFQVYRKAMCQEMTGFWVGPCEVDKFFELTMPLSLYKFLAPHSLSSESLDIMQKPSQGAPLLEHLEIDSELLNLPLANVHTLHFYAEFLVSEESWATELSNLKSLPNLRSVEVCPLSALPWFEVFPWCMNCGADRCFLHGVQEVVVWRFPNKWPALGENMGVVRDARPVQGRPIVYRYEGASSQLPSNMYG
ncbi:hypothetical protein PLEOSDRAFT_1080113 [Pleurotus ostreatus PC15]|uniref:F-box domain-containing protein n=1 Tax=Pleurotus ostreatus (strain PC15) TaxID=1137138 RepID=A0A067NZX8_PLEO1|nr:hypothetical protein PLEOSDRAFT_1080113 [Pleurotus ostreatus PC15]